MAEKKEDGGQAFPMSGEDGACEPWDIPGMTLRQYYAGQALAGHMAGFNRFGMSDAQAHAMAKDCVKAADAVIDANKADG